MRVKYHRAPHNRARFYYDTAPAKAPAMGRAGPRRAVARETLKAVPAHKSGVPADQLITSDGAVHLPNGTSLSYVELAQIAAEIDPIADVTLRSHDDCRLIENRCSALILLPNPPARRFMALTKTRPA